MRSRSALPALALSIVAAAAAPAVAAPIAPCRAASDLSTAALGAPPADEIHADVPTAAYLLSLIWTPETCRTQGGGSGGGGEMDTECRLNRFGFTVHGLWPNGAARVHPRYCRPAPAVSAEVIRRNICMTPSAHLLQHEWAAHGACGWAAPAEYFEQARKLREALDPPLLTPNADGFLTAGAVRDAFIARNPAIPRTALDVHVGRANRLEEVRVCYDLRFRYAPCLSGTGAPDAAPIGVTPVAAGPAPAAPPAG